MINEIKENPGEQNSSQVGSKTTSVKDYIEVVPSVPLYRMQGYAILKITKLIFDPEEIHPNKMVLESSVGSCILIDNDYNDLDEFSTFPNRPDTIAWYPAEEFLYHCDKDIDHAVEEFRDWGITQVDLGHGLDITVDVRTFLEAIKEFKEGDTDEIVIPCQREVAAELHFLCKEIDDDEEDDEDVEEEKDAD